LNPNLLIGQINEEFMTTAREAVSLLQERGGSYRENAERISTSIEEVNARAVLKLAFIGQYSAGKSSIISALTGNRHIKIDADIATDHAENYLWNGILLTDTPGLFTERKDHDQKTYDAIRASDLLFFVITSDLFDDIILQNFIKLAYTENYRHKMRLLVNKMSMEAGDFDELKENYYETLKKSLHPYDISEFDISFIDAADYLEGMRSGKTAYVEMSHFGDFVQHLNQFVESKGLLGKMDTPFRLLISELDKALLEAGENQNDKTFFMLLSRIEDRVKKSLRNAENQLHWITGELRSKIVALGSGLSAKIGQPNIDFNGENRMIENTIMRLTEEASEKLSAVLEEERNELNEELRQIFESDLAEAFLKSIEHSAVLNINDVKTSDLSSLQKNFKSLSTVVDKVSGGVIKLANEGGKQASGLLLTASGVAGSQMHKGIYAVGKFFGHSFKPWQAVNLATKVGNVFKVLGPVVAIASAIFELVQMGKESADLQKVLAAKQECMNDFIELAQSVETEFEKQFASYKDEFYYSVLTEIEGRRKSAIDEHQLNTNFEKELFARRKRVEHLLEEIHKK
jgi:NTP pyrophosphatase (non-canonical NTP hydrolase)